MNNLKYNNKNNRTINLSGESEFGNETVTNLVRTLYVLLSITLPGWKVRQRRTECQETDKILRTKTEINVHTKIALEGEFIGFFDNVI